MSAFTIILIVIVAFLAGMEGVLDTSGSSTSRWSHARSSAW